MKELSEIVNTQITSMIEGGAIEEMIAERLNTAIKEAIDGSMRGYGDFGKAIKEKIESSLNHAIDNVTFPEYNKFVSDVALEAYGEVLNGQAKNQITNMIKEQLEPVPLEITAQDLMDKISSFWGDDCRHEGHDEIEIEWNDGSGVHLKIIHPEYDWQTIKISCYDHNDTDTFHIGYIYESSKGKLSGTLDGATQCNSLANYLYKLYCAQTQITNIGDVYGDNIYIGRDD